MKELQLANASWNKAAYCHEWMAIGEKSNTAGGNMKAPEKLPCLQWVKKAWDSVSKEVMVNSFKVCVETNGSEDSLIHCVKPGLVAADAAAEISTETATKCWRMMK